MQLKIQRSQRAGGVLGNTVFFCLDVRADYSPEEQSNIQKYKLGSQLIYNSEAARKHLENMNTHLNRVDNYSLKEKAAGLGRGALSLALAKMKLNISIASLGRGHHIECKDLEELLGAEETVRNSCKNITRYLEVAATFDGSETVIEYHKGDETIHITQAASPLLIQASPDEAREGAESYRLNHEGAGSDRPPAYEFGQQVSKFWANPRYRKFTYIVVFVVTLIFLLRSCF